MRSRRALLVLAIRAVSALVSAVLLSGQAGFRPDPQSAEATSLNEIKKLLASDAQASDRFGRVAVWSP